MTVFVGDVYIKDEGNFCLLWTWSDRLWGILQQKGKLIKKTKTQKHGQRQNHNLPWCIVDNCKQKDGRDTKYKDKYIIWPLLPRCIVEKGTLNKGKEGTDKVKGKNKGKDINKDTDNLTFVTSMHSWQRQTQGERRIQRGHRRRSKRLELYYKIGILDSYLDFFVLLNIFGHIIKSIFAYLWLLCTPLAAAIYSRQQP